MKKFSKIIGIFILMSIFLVGCNSNLDKKSTSLKEVNISSIKDNNYFTTTPKEELENKAFLVENSSDQYIVFYKMNIDKEKRTISVQIDLDDEICTVMDYFEIFLNRMIMCRRAAEHLNCKFKLVANGSKLC